MWVVLGAAVLIFGFSVWTIYGGFSFGISRFFAASDQVVDDGGGGGGAPTVNPAASTASCGSLGGTDCKGRTTSGCGAGFTDVGQKTTDCDSGYGFCCKPVSGGSAPTPTPTSGGGPTDPTGACTFRTAFNAPEGAWFCNSLQCQLDGNPSGGQEFPPQGPAVSLATKVFRTIDAEVNPSDGPIHIRTVLDATPKCSNGKECYPNRDPLWVCTAAEGVMYQGGRDGSDFYDCYNPIIHRTNYGPITCCAGTNLSGDCFTWNLEAPAGKPAPSTTPTGGLPSPAQLSVQCGANQNVLTWVTPLPAGSNASAINKTSTAPGGSPVAVQIGINLGTNPSSYTDTDVQAGYTYSYRFKNHVSVASNTVTCPTAAQTPAPTATATVQPTPTQSVAPGAPVQCAPTTQTVQLNQIARLEAAGGNGIFRWDVLQGGDIEEGGNAYIGVSYATTGLKTIRVNGSGSSAQCTVDVISGMPTSTVSPSSALSILKSGRNTTVGEPTDDADVSVYPGQTAQFTIRIANNGPTTLSGVRLTDSVPAGMSYRSGTTRVEGQSVAADSITTAGLVIGQLDPGETVNVQWSAIANRTAEITAGPNLTSPAARVSADGVSDATSDIAVTVYGSGAASGAGGIPTGPGDAVFAALAAAAVLTLLYSGYTRSGLYRRREAEIVSRDQGPMDFRS